jgi:hypothetical protein
MIQTLVGIVVGFVLARGSTTLDRWRRRKAHMAALRAEINLCDRLAGTYLAVLQGASVSPSDVGVHCGAAEPLGGWRVVRVSSR